jgi:predicted ArsR family transcriptional regulator
VKPETQSVHSDDTLDKRSGEPSADVAAVASLDEPTRRRIYDHVSAQASPLSRDDVAEALGISRRTSAFHLDRLAEQGLLSVSFARRSGRSGPGAGRPAKLYQRSAHEVSVTLPPRQYDLAGALLAGAVEEAQLSGEPPRQVLDQRARDFGRAIALEQSRLREKFTQGEPPGHEGCPERRDTDALMSLLAAHGFEPQLTGDDVTLNNCPFHSLAKVHTGLICGMNLQLLQGVLEGLGQTGLHAYLDPAPPHCCVRMSASDQK